MSDLTHIFLSLSSALLALFIGLAVYKRLTKFYCLLFFQVLVYLVLDCISVPFMPYNSWIFNIMILVETLLLFTAAQAYFNTEKSKRILLFLFSLFAIVYLIDLTFITGITTFAYHASIMEGILISAIFITVLYFQLGQGLNTLDNRSVILICLGMVMYFSGSIPYLSTLFYFQKKDPVLNLKLFRNIIELLAHVRYVCLALGFYLEGKKFSAINCNRN